MFDANDAPTDLTHLSAPQVGSLAATGDLFQPYRLLDAAGAPDPGGRGVFRRARRLWPAGDDPALLRDGPFALVPLPLCARGRLGTGDAARGPRLLPLAGGDAQAAASALAPAPGPTGAPACFGAEHADRQGRTGAALRAGDRRARRERAARLLRLPPRGGQRPDGQSLPPRARGGAAGESRRTTILSSPSQRRAAAATARSSPNAHHGGSPTRRSTSSSPSSPRTATRRSSPSTSPRAFAPPSCSVRRSAMPIRDTSSSPSSARELRPPAGAGLARCLRLAPPLPGRGPRRRAGRSRPAAVVDAAPPAPPPHLRRLPGDVQPGQRRSARTGHCTTFATPPPTGWLETRAFRSPTSSG